MPAAPSPIQIRNLVGLSDVGTRLDLSLLSRSFENSEYVTEHYYALIYKPRNARGSILVNSSGKIIVVGVRSVQEATESVKGFVRALLDIGIRAQETPLKVQNIVGTFELGRELDLDHLLLALPGDQVDAELEPEQFPGLILRTRFPKLTVLLFRSGKIVCTGAKKVEDLEAGRQFVLRLLARL